MNLLSVNPFHLQTHPAIVNEHRLTDMDNIAQSSVGNGKRFRGAGVALVRDEGHLLTLLEFYHSLADRAHSNLWTLQVPVSYTHLRAHETDSYLVCRLLLEKKKKTRH